MSNKDHNIQHTDYLQTEYYGGEVSVEDFRRLSEQMGRLTTDFRKQLDELSQRNYDLRRQNLELQARVDQLQRQKEQMELGVDDTTKERAIRSEYEDILHVVANQYDGTDSSEWSIGANHVFKLFGVEISKRIKRLGQPNRDGS